MTRPGNRRASAQEARLAASLSGAVDLSGLKERAEAKRKPGPRAGAGGGPAAAGGSTSTSVRVTEENFEAEVLRRSMQVPVLVELGSERAPTTLTQELDTLAAQDRGLWVHAYVDVDQQPAIAQAFRAQAIPMVIAVAGGRPLTEFEGEQPADVLRQFVDSILKAVEGKLEGPATGDGEQPEDGEPADPERDAAEAALAEGDLAAAEQAYQSLVDSRSGDHTLVEALRFVQAARRVAEEQDPAAQGHDAAVAEAMRAADVSVVAGNYADGFATLVAAIRTSAGDAKNVLRTRLLELLDSLPANDPDVLAARRDLATALY